MNELLRKKLPVTGAEIPNEKGEVKKVEKTYFSKEKQQYMILFEDGSEMPANKMRQLKIT